MKRSAKTAPPPPTHEWIPNPWLAGMQAVISSSPQPLYIYLLVDEEGAALIAQGTLPAYVQVQAQRALDWNLSDAGR